MKTALFIFDMGGVLIEKGVNFPEIAAFLGLDERTFMKDYEKYDTPLLEGWMETLSYMRHLEGEFGLHIEGDLFSRIYHPYVNTSLLPILEMIRRSGKRIVIGSNTFRPHADVIEKLDDKPFSYFDAVYFSHEMHLSKPSLSFFRYILEKEGASPLETFFVDDSAENILSAQSLGIRTFLYSRNRNGELGKEVERLLSL